MAQGEQDPERDALTAALEKQTWDPSVKSLVNFPQVLDMMNEKLDLTQRLGDACLAQQKDVLDAIQRLRAKAQAQGNLKTTKEQTVIVEQPPAQTTIVEQPAAQTTVIKIEPANPQVVYVPTYNPTVVYGAWPYPTYPPYTYYPPGYAAATAAFSFTAGVALGAAWGYAWGDATGTAGMSTSMSTVTPILIRILTARVSGKFSSARAKCRKAHGGMTRRTGGVSRIAIKGPRSGSTEALMRKPLRPGKRFAAEPRVVGKNSRAAEQTGSGKRGRESALVPEQPRRPRWRPRWAERPRRWAGEQVSTAQWLRRPRWWRRGRREADRQMRSRDLGGVAMCVTRARVAPRAGAGDRERQAAGASSVVAAAVPVVVAGAGGGGRHR